MSTWAVRLDIGPLYTTVEATDEDDAIDKALEEWEGAAYDIFNGGTFYARETSA